MIRFPRNKILRRRHQHHEAVFPISFFIALRIFLIHSDMLERARKHRDAHTYQAETYEEFKDIVENKPGFVKAMWCGCQECEDRIKEETGATSRCMPFRQEQLSDTCVCCGKPAKKMVYWGRAY